MNEKTTLLRLCGIVVTVFIYLQMNPAPAPTLCLEEGSNVTLQGKVVQKYVQKDELVVQLDHVSASQPKQKIDGRGFVLS